MLGSLGEGCERVESVDGINRDQGGSQMYMLSQIRIDGQQIDDGIRISKSGGLDQYLREHRAATSQTRLQQRGESECKVTSDRTAYAATCQFHKAIVARLDQMMVDANVAIFIDDDRAVVERFGFQ